METFSLEAPKIIPLLLGPILGFLVFAFANLGLGNQAQLVLGITILAAVYWFTEALELHVTGFLISILLIIVAGFKPGDIFPAYFDPIVVLLLGGFVLAQALQKYEIDHQIAQHLLTHIGSKPERVLLAFMALTAFVSLWMSNTAAAAIMLPIGLYVLHQNKLPIMHSSYAKALLLGIAYAATIGGMGTLVGSTPNPIAAKYITEMGISFGFWDYLYYAFPFTIIFLLIVWFVLQKFFPPEIQKISIRMKEHRWTKEQKHVIIVFLFTVLLWITDSITGIPVSVSALIPVVLLYFLRLINTEDFNKIDWPVLLLIGSGIIIGNALHATHIDTFIVEQLGNYSAGQPLFLVVFLVAIVGILVTMFVSNTASAALMIPLTAPLAVALAIPPQILIMVTALAVSTDFTAPMGTPPNAMVFSTKAVSVKQMAKLGLTVSLIAAILLSLFASFLWTIH